MQTLKEEVRSKIIEAAVKEFIVHGYEKASMRPIAKAAGISVSNTYNYFKSKDEMFGVIIGPVFDRLKDIMRQSFQQSMKGGLGNNLPVFIDHMVKELIKMETRERELLIILAEKSAGTKFEKSRDEMVNMIKMHLAETVRKPGGSSQIEENQGYILNIIADNYIDALFRILKDYKNREWAEANLRTMLTYHLSGIKALLA